MLIEINGLKEFNEKYGFLAGDELLQLVANALKTSSADDKNKLVARLGGGSFAILTSNLNAQEANGMVPSACRLALS